MSRVGLSKEKVIEEAAKLANEKGLSGITVTSLSAYLGIRKPSLYYHVKSTEEVFQELMLYGWRKVSCDLVSNIQEDDPKQAIRVFGHSIYHFALDNPGVFEAMLWYNNYEDERFTEMTKGLYQFFFAQMDKLGIDQMVANHLLRTFRAFWEGYALLVIHNSFGNPISIEESYDLSLDVLLNGIEQYRRK